MSPKKRDKTTRNLALTVIVFCVLALLITLFVLPYINRLTDPHYQQELSNWAVAASWKGWLLFVLMQAGQIIISPIPGGPIQIASGVLYGIWGGFFIMLVGSVVGSAVSFWLARKLGAPLINRILGEDRINEFRFMRDTKIIDLALFVVFLIPGTPKDLLSYFLGVTSIGMGRFLFISTLARTPAMLSSTVIGSSLQNGNMLLAVGVFAGLAVVSLLAVRYREEILDYVHRLGGHAD